MASDTLKKCPLCKENFNKEDRCPRTLPCSHYFCTFCIKQVITNDDKLCPVCNSNFEASSADDIMRNRAVLDFLKYVSHEVTPFAEKVANEEKEITDIRSCLNLACEDMREEAESAIAETEEIIKDLEGYSTKIDEELLSRVIKIKQVNEYKQKELINISQSLTDRMNEITEKQEKLQETKARVEKANNFKEAAVLVDEAKVTSSAMKEWTAYCKTLGDNDKKRLQNVEKGILEAKEKTEKSMEVLGYLWEEVPEKKIQQNLDHEGSSPGQITVEELRKMNEHIKSLVEQEKVYAIQVQQGVTRTARINIHDNRLCLYRLETKLPPANSYTVDHQDVLQLVDPSTRFVFLELGTKTSNLGRLYIRLSPDTDAAKQFAMLCSGELGPTYANSRLIGVVDKGKTGEQVRFGDYEYQNGTGGKALVKGLASKTEYHRPELNGTVTGVGWSIGKDAWSAQFIIRTRGDSKKMYSDAFGIVDEGLSVLIEAIQCFSDVKQLFIKHCGLVLVSSLSIETVP